MFAIGRSAGRQPQSRPAATEPKNKRQLGRGRKVSGQEPDAPRKPQEGRREAQTRQGLHTPPHQKNQKRTHGRILGCSLYAPFRTNPQI